MTAPHAAAETLPAAPAAAVVDGIDAGALAAAAQACAGVAALDGGRFGEATTYLPGLRVPGVLIGAKLVTVQIRARWGVPAADLLSQVAAAVTPIIGGRRLQVAVADIDDPPAPEAPLSLPPEAASAGAALPGAAGWTGPPT